MSRKLTEAEIKNILSFLVPNPHLPKDSAYSIYMKTYRQLEKQLKKCSILPLGIPKLKKQLKKQYQNSLIPPGECVGVITAQSIGERQTQSNLNAFHKAGSADKQPVVFKFSELLNVTNKPKAPCYFIHFTEGDKTIQDLRKTIGHDIIQISFKKITKSFELGMCKRPEPWYDAFYALYDVDPDKDLRDCISIKLNMDVLYEYKLTMKDIADFISEKYIDMTCIFSPDCYGQIDVYVDTRNITLPEEKTVFVNEENMVEIYLEEVVQPILESTIICGIPGVLNLFFVEDKTEKRWFIETENARDKAVEKIKFKKTKEKPADSTKRYKTVLALPQVDKTKTISNNVWDIYYTFGIEAARQYMIDEFSNIMKGINLCHVMLLVDKMTFSGNISSVSRYSMRREDSVLSKASFEETLDHFYSAGVYGQKDHTQGVSASIICGKRAKIGTGVCDLEMDMEKLATIQEGDE